MLANKCIHDPFLTKRLIITVWEMQLLGFAGLLVSRCVNGLQDRLCFIIPFLCQFVVWLM